MQRGETAGGVADIGVFVGGDGVRVVCADVEADSFEDVRGGGAVVAEGGGIGDGSK